jgi:hypothetical protein
MQQGGSMSLAPHLDILSPEDVLAAIHHTKIAVTIRGVSFEVQAPTIEDLCEIVARFPDLLELLDGSKRTEEDGNADALVYLLRRAPKAVMAFCSCAMDRAGDLEFEKALLGKPSDFKRDLAFAAVDALYREHGTLESFFQKTVARLHEMGLTHASKMLFVALDLISKISQMELPATQPTPAPKAKRSGGRKAA